MTKNAGMGELSGISAATADWEVHSFGPKTAPTSVAPAKNDATAAPRQNARFPHA